MKENINIDILRYRPESDVKPVWQSYSIPYNLEMSVLDALAHIKNHLDSTISYRWSCRMAICGSCGMMINGVPKLACKTFLREYDYDIKLEALSNFPIERDLIVDMSDYIARLEAIKPYLIRDDKFELTNNCNQQTPTQLFQYKQFAMCINCGLCYAACPQYSIDNQFAGPAVLALLHRYNIDSRDHGNSERNQLPIVINGAISCSFEGYCTDVCPQKVDPAAAIYQLRQI